MSGWLAGNMLSSNQSPSSRKWASRSVSAVVPFAVLLPRGVEHLLTGR